MSTLLKKSISVAAAGLLFANLYSQSFEGVIEFKKQTESDTTNYVYYIKGDKVRVDEVGAKFEKSEGSYLIDLKANTVVAVSSERKMYFNQPPSTIPPMLKCKPEVTKTSNTKMIHEFKCTEYIVKCTEEKTQISYWMAAGKFDFFDRMVRLLNRKDKSAVYFLQITGTQGMFPFVSIENTIGGGEKTRMEVTKIQKKSVDASKFEIPKGYTKSVD